MKEKYIFTCMLTKHVFFDLHSDGIYRSPYSRITYTLEEAMNNKNFTMQNEKGEFITREIKK